MRVTKLNSDKFVLVKVAKYLIDWEKDGSSSLEIRLRDLIKPYWKNYIVTFQFPVVGSKYRIDFLNCSKRLAIETDGRQHNNFVKFFHNNSRAGFLSSIKRDMDKEKWCEQNNIKLIHLIEEDLDNFSREYIIDKFGVDII